MARRHQRHEEPESHERWLVSYADFITLLFAFFVVMYAISSVNEGKYRVLSESLEEVFTSTSRSADPIQVGEVSRGNSSQVVDAGTPVLPVIETRLPDVSPFPSPIDDGNEQTAVKQIDDVAEQLNNALVSLIDNEDVKIIEGEDWLEVEIKSNFLFASGDARMASEAIPVIGQIADVLSPINNPIQVEGFTDNIPINTPQFPSNWELSASRAASVVNIMDRFGVAPGRMSAIGYGEFRPVADNDTEAGRQKNRRVVLVVLGNENSRRNLDLNRSSSLPLDASVMPPISPEDITDNSTTADLAASP
ncbi:Flagellar motor rotation protein MotB [Methylophaga frappieri]|uniref:Flagellar motor rotation protein MotB n=1 Tax=Methylophaga frappieri (strain ATCC BAA-2434 / DSM 25690 / JAM7) TaxID=754477 RepID=I1YHM7_METFJ|nr:flagellar motor protein MotD [Methylophaga frappieri]AFJ02420.1 Flagellar motor rotation protein MotB [Methylophaga frappieri]